MKVLRTPDQRFESLPDYPFEPHYLEIRNAWGPDLRMHYVDEGPADAPSVVMLHGEPTWSYFYRHLIPPMVRAGHRVLAPDLIGFGRSDKPAATDDYTYERMVEWTSAWFRSVKPRRVSLILHDWGGLIGLRVVAGSSRAFERIIAMNTGLPTGAQVMSPESSMWKLMAHNMPVLPVGQVVNGGCFVELSRGVIDAYDAPFPDESFKSGARALPGLVPVRPDDPSAAENRTAWRSLRRFSKPFLTVFSDLDPMNSGGEEEFKSGIPGAAGRPHTRLRRAGHFITEDRTDRLIKVLCKFIRS
ncbi:MAG TPA: haloalkane dehalogenase [Acidimicrobiia bacterium]|nr:haloalkane dehalogenase [Acidimicrobiia bacterium]